MKSTKLAILLSTFLAAGAMAQSPAPSESTNNQVLLAGGTAINAELDTSIDSKKAKSGEAVMAHTTEAMKATDNREIMAKGTKLMGHVTQAASRSNGGTETMVAIQFDKAKLKDGQEVPLANFMIQALAAPSSAASSFTNDNSGINTYNDRMGAPSNTPSSNPSSNNPSMSGSRGARPDNTPSPQSYPSAEPNSTSGAQPNAAGPLPVGARGVYGLQGVRLATAGAGNTEGSVIVSDGKNLRLDKGTRLLLVGQPPSGATASSR
jgi:hypothetical protein